MRLRAGGLLVTLVISTAGGPALGHHSFAAEFTRNGPSH